ncbi:hypothetical protein HYC85_002128 [Camellia sinensis]|uniref:26S proteasome non-ATPase regulatory subunit 4 homolog n=1 Tax=Camellia sinensis TaxID=4442 RepID=A0A7J7I7N0_CAMSI|nr:hypothetical protein HYC85_002128 [Camellia sinensis]
MLNLVHVEPGVDFKMASSSTNNSNIRLKLRLCNCGRIAAIDIVRTNENENQGHLFFVCPSKYMNLRCHDPLPPLVEWYRDGHYNQQRTGRGRRRIVQEDYRNLRTSRCRQEWVASEGGSLVKPLDLQRLISAATMICIDNSEWMRNGDYSPTRSQAQADAVNLICGAKTQSNPENTVGVLTMAGKGVRVLVTPTSDLGKILACMHGVEIGGDCNLAAGIQVAQLALKHRQNKKQQQRIIFKWFVSVLSNTDKKVLEIIGRKLKKNSVALDIVSFGEEDDGKTEKLEALLGAVNNNDSSHIVHVPPGPNALADVLISTPIFTGDGEGGSGFAAAAAAAAAGGVSGFDFGVDPNMDPELALALRVSMEEERARQEAAAKKAAEECCKTGKRRGTGIHITRCNHD